jgi:hypothetical protein
MFITIVILLSTLYGSRTPAVTSLGAGASGADTASDISRFNQPYIPINLFGGITRGPDGHVKSDFFPQKNINNYHFPRTPFSRGPNRQKDMIMWVPRNLMGNCKNTTACAIMKEWQKPAIDLITKIQQHIHWEDIPHMALKDLLEKLAEQSSWKRFPPENEPPLAARALPEAPAKVEAEVEEAEETPEITEVPTGEPVPEPTTTSLAPEITEDPEPTTTSLAPEITEETEEPAPAPAPPENYVQDEKGRWCIEKERKIFTPGIWSFLCSSSSPKEKPSHGGGQKRNKRQKTMKKFSDTVKELIPNSSQGGGYLSKKKINKFKKKVSKRKKF